MNRPSTHLFLILTFAVGIISGCRSTPKRAWIDPIHLDNWPRELRKHPMPAGANMHKIDLGGTKNASHHLVRVRDREPYHLHAEHDLTVFVLSGHGDIIIDGTTRACTIGNVLFIPRGVPHAFVNKSDKVAVAYAVFTPAMRVKDFVKVPAVTGK